MFSQEIKNELESIYSKHNLMGLTVQTFSKNNLNSYNFGLQNLDTKDSITNQTSYRIASISKTFTALGLLKLYDKKLFKLDDDISNYLGYNVINPNFPKEKITFRMLLSHTSSIQDGTGYDSFLGATYAEKEIPSIKTLIEPNGKYFTQDMFLNQKPGSYFTYCNLNYGIIGTLIEKISGQRFDIFIKNEILKPIGITGSFNLDEIDFEDLATLYRSENNVWKSQKDDYSESKPNKINFENYSLGNNAIYLGPQGGLRINALDLIKILKYLKNDGEFFPNLISKKTIKKMKKSQWVFNKNNGDTYNGFFKSYGLGLHKTNKKSSDFFYNPSYFDSFIGHAGDAYGLISDAYFSEKQDFGFVIVTNGSFNPFIKGKTSSFYEFEEEIFKVICDDFIRTNQLQK